MKQSVNPVLPAGRLSNKMIAASVRKKREEINAFMADKGLNQASLAKLVGLSKPSISRALHAEPPTLTPGLRKLHAYVVAASSNSLGEALVVAMELTQGRSKFDAAIAARILRVVASALECSAYVETESPSN
ncbi:helix-turn-helix domain-containing protein [Dyella amyloliquefaciens]|uniref:helix-turn-helix domain-containing protein n=1 Tax=Dyella amyloliquefaciens TaxID=1770545 RepID=UPI00102EB19E|nr:helix-turn-helix transcriptional regulator [Dyella amyloliquefaciens]